MPKSKKLYEKPKLKSSKVKIINFYGRSSLRGVADSEMLMLTSVTY